MSVPNAIANAHIRGASRWQRQCFSASDFPVSVKLGPDSVRTARPATRNSRVRPASSRSSTVPAAVPPQIPVPSTRGVESNPAAERGLSRSSPPIPDRVAPSRCNRIRRLSQTCANGSNIAFAVAPAWPTREDWRSRPGMAGAWSGRWSARAAKPKTFRASPTRRRQRTATAPQGTRAAAAAGNSVRSRPPGLVGAFQTNQARPAPIGARMSFTTLTFRS